MYRALIVIAALIPGPALAAELWCMPHTLCRWDGTCRATDDEESSVRLHDMQAATSSLRTHAEDVLMTRKPGDGVVEWTGTNTVGNAERLVWTRADMTYTYVQTEPGGDTFSATGLCEVQ